MGIFLDAAYNVLKKEKQPLSPKEIVLRAKELGLLFSSGKTPWQTMKSKLSTDILMEKQHSLFMRTDKGKFALREWSNQTAEYVAERYQKALLDEDILVFPKAILNRFIPHTGLFLNTTEDSALLFRQCFSMNRRIAETDKTVIQLVSGFLVHYEDQYLTYKRTKRLPETRLHGFYSILFGGHLNPEDSLPLFNIFEPAFGQILLERELSEELVLKSHPNINYKGLIYDDTIELSSQHLGILFDVRLPTPEFIIGERGFLMDPRLETLHQIESRINDFENWSILVIKDKMPKK